MKTNIVIIISANAEWEVVKRNFRNAQLKKSPYGEWFLFTYQEILNGNQAVIFFHGGWGKVSAAASTQYVINNWHPKLIVNLGTCGGFEGKINKGELILVDKTVIYDIYEQMGDAQEHINDYSVELDNSWLNLPYPLHIRQSILVSGDRDLIYDDIANLTSKYGAIAADWESGAIAWVAAKNHIKCLILRGVTDLVGKSGGEAYNGNISVFLENSKIIMKTLLDSLPLWIIQFINYQKELLNGKEANPL